MSKMIAVESSHIDAIGYDEGKKELAVEFSSGMLYCYEGVPLQVWKELKGASSKGAYLHKNIKGVYEYRKG